MLGTGKVHVQLRWKGSLTCRPWSGREKKAGETISMGGEGSAVLGEFRSISSKNGQNIMG